MEPRKKPTPNPIARPSAPRSLSPARPRPVLPTVAALLALAAIGCDRETIRRDDVASTMGQTLHVESAPADITPNVEEPAKPSLGVLEDPPPVPPPHPVIKAKPVHPHPKPDSPPMPGGLKAVSPIDTI